MTKSNFHTILDDYTSAELAQMAESLRAEGYTLHDATRDEYETDSVKRSFENFPATGGWSDAWVYQNPEGKRYAVFSDGGGIIRKAAALDGTARGARSHRDDLAAAVLVRMT